MEYLALHATEINTTLHYCQILLSIFTAFFIVALAIYGCFLVAVKFLDMYYERLTKKEARERARRYGY